MPQIHRGGTHSVGLVSLSNMDNQPAETCKKYSTENPAFWRCDVGLGICSGTWPGSELWHRGRIDEQLAPAAAGKPSKRLRAGTLRLSIRFAEGR
jgi:hypothetical protein